MMAAKLYQNIINRLSKGSVTAILLWLVAASYAEMFIKNGYRKFDPEGFWSNSFVNTWGYGLGFMYFIGVLEFVGGLFLLVPRLIPIGSLVLAVVMVGAMVTRIIFDLLEGVKSEDYYNFFYDQLFFVSTIAMLLFFAAYWAGKRKSDLR